MSRQNAQPFSCDTRYATNTSSFSGNSLFFKALDRENIGVINSCGTSLNEIRSFIVIHFDTRQPSTKKRDKSYPRKLFTGFTTAALKASNTTITIALASVKTPDNEKIHHRIAI